MSPNLDLLRAVAVLCVFFAHFYDALTNRHSPITQDLGQLGVVMFFVHTSLVLMQSLDRSKLTGRALFGEFYLHRFFRLYPLSIACVTLAFLVPGSAWTIRELLTNLTLIQNLTYDGSMVGGLWTLPLEVQMYVILPFLFIWFRQKPVSWLLAFWVLSLPFAFAQPYVSGRLSVIGYIPCFLGGVIAWRMGDRKILSGWLWPLALVMATIPLMASEGNYMYPRWATCLALGLSIPWFREIPSAWLNLVTKTIAKYSYGIYLSHAAVIALVFEFMSDQPALFQAGVFVTLVTALPLLAYHLVEQPMIKLGRKLSEKSMLRSSSLSIARP